MATPQWCRSVRHPLASLDLKTSGFSTRYSGGADKRLLFRHSLERCFSLLPAHCFGERRPASSLVAPSCLPSGCQSGCQWAGPARPNVYPSRAVVQRDCRCVRDGEPAGERCEQHRPGSDSASIGWADAGLCLAPAPPLLPQPAHLRSLVRRTAPQPEQEPAAAPGGGIQPCVESRSR